MTSKEEIFENEYYAVGIVDNVNATGKAKQDLIAPRRRSTVLTNLNFVIRQEKIRDTAIDLLDTQTIDTLSLCFINCHSIAKSNRKRSPH